MSLERYTNNTEILNTKNRLEGFVLSKNDINTLNQDIAVLSEFTPKANSKYTISVEAHIYNSNGDYISSNYNTEYKHSIKYSDFTFDIAKVFDSSNLLYGNFKLSMSFLVNLLGNYDDNPFYLEEISPDRTELKLTVKDSYISKNFNIVSEVELFKNFAGSLKVKNLLTNLVLNFNENKIVPIVNIKVDCRDRIVLYIKLYSPLLSSIVENDICHIAYKVLEDYVDIFNVRSSNLDTDSALSKYPNSVKILSNASYTTCSETDVSNETDIKNWNSLLDTDADTSNSIIRRIFSGSQDVELNIDYTDFNNFIYYGSAAERIKNYDYKLKLIEYLNSQYIQADNTVSGSLYSVKSASNYTERIKKIVDSFDRFESFLYTKTGSLFSYDISGSVVPSPKYIANNRYVNYPTTSSQYLNWYSSHLNVATEYDRTNYTSLYYNTPDHILRDERNSQYVLFLHMVGQHFDNTYGFIKKLTSIHQRDEHPERGIPNELLPYYAKSLGWKIQNTRNLSDLWLYKLGTDSTGSYSEASGELLSKSYENLTHQIWRRIVNNLPYLLKTKGSTRSVRALFSIYGIPFTLISVKEYGGPQIDEDNPPLLSEDKFQYLLNFKQNQYIEIPRRLYTSSLDNISKVPQTTEFRFRTDYTGSVSMSLWAVEESSNRNNVLQNLELVHYTSSLYGKRTYGYLKYTVKTGSLGNLKAIRSTSSLMPLFDNDIWTVRMYSNHPVYNGSPFNGTINIDCAKSSDFVDNRISISSSFSISANPNSLLYSLGATSNILPSGHKAVLGGTTGSNSVRFSGSLQSYREYMGWYSKRVFDAHVLNPSSYNANSYTSSYDELFRYYPIGIDNIRDNHSVYYYVSSSHPNQKFYGDNPATFKNFTGTQETQYTSKVETHYRQFPSLGANNPKSNKIRFESTKLDNNLAPDRRATVSRYDKEQRDSNRLSIVFSPTDQLNKDISNQFGAYNFENFVGDPKDSTSNSYKSLDYARNEYFKKFARSNDIGKFIEIFSLYDYSVFEQVKQLVPARANLITGVLIEPSLLERSKIERKFPIVSYPKQETLLKGAVMDIESNLVPNNIGVLDYSLEIEIERSKEKTNIKYSPKIELERDKLKSECNVVVDVEVEMNKYKVIQSMNLVSIDNNVSNSNLITDSVGRVSSMNTEVSLKDYYNNFIKSNNETNIVLDRYNSANTPNSSIKVTNSYFKNIQPLSNADVILQYINYTYKDSNGVLKQKSSSDYVYKPFTIEADVTERNLYKNNVLNKNEYAVGSFYVRDNSLNIVEFNESQLSSSNFKFYFKTVQPNISSERNLTGLLFREFLNKYKYSIYNKDNTIYRNPDGGGIINQHISGSSINNFYKKVKYHFSSSGNFILGQTSPNMLKSPVYLSGISGKLSDYSRELNYKINKEYKAYYSSSIEYSNYQYVEDSSIMRVRFRGSKISGAGINIDSTETVYGGPVVSVKIVNENEIIVQ
jgi:hypothetical protein